MDCPNGASGIFITTLSYCTLSYRFDANIFYFLGKASRICNETSGWSEPDTSACTGKAYLRLQTQVIKILFIAVNILTFNTILGI